MPSDYYGIPTPLESLLPGAINVASSTNASPIVVTTSTAHGATTGDTVVVNGHLVNTAANGAWECVVLSATTLELVGSTGNGAGVATGTLRDAGFGSSIQLPSGTDPRDVSSVNVPLEGLGDRSALLLYLLHYEQHIYAGGGLTFDADSQGFVSVGSTFRVPGLLRIESGGTLEILTSHFVLDSDADASLAGTVDFPSTSVVTFEGATHLHTSLQVHNDASIDLFASGGTWGQINVNNGTLIEVHGGSPAGKIQVDNGASIVLLGSSSVLEANGNISVLGTLTSVSATVSHTGMTETIDATSTIADAGKTTKSGPTVYSGDDGYVGGRAKLNVTADLDQSIDPWKYEVVELATSPNITADRVWTLSDTPNNERVPVLFIMNVSNLDTHKVTIKDSGGATVIVFDGLSAGSMKWALLRYVPGGSPKWAVFAWNAKDYTGTI